MITERTEQQELRRERVKEIGLGLEIGFAGTQSAPGGRQLDGARKFDSWKGRILSQQCPSGGERQVADAGIFAYGSGALFLDHNAFAGGNPGTFDIEIGDRSFHPQAIGLDL